VSGLFVHFHAIPLIMVPFSQVLRYLYHQFSLFYEMKLANKKKKVSYLDGVKKIGHFSHLADRMAQIANVS